MGIAFGPIRYEKSLIVVNSDIGDLFSIGPEFGPGSWTIEKKFEEGKIM